MNYVNIFKINKVVLSPTFSHYIVDSFHLNKHPSKSSFLVVALVFHPERSSLFGQSLFDGYLGCFQFISYESFYYHVNMCRIYNIHFFWPCLQHAKFPGQGWNLCHRRNPSYCRDYATSLTLYATRELPILK